VQGGLGEQGRARSGRGVGQGLGRGVGRGSGEARRGSDEWRGGAPVEASAGELWEQGEREREREKARRGREREKLGLLYCERGRGEGVGHQWRH
jgi:hypothetical protein